jgi:hypothetical protein
MTAPQTPLPTHTRCVHNFEELADARFENGVNALFWPRVLTGDFAEIVSKVIGSEGVQMLTTAQLESLELGQAGKLAREHLLADLARLQALGCDPQLNCIRSYPRDTSSTGIATDVYSFHVDSAPCQTDTWLCTYQGEPSQMLSNQDALRRVDDPATRAQLLGEYGGKEDAAFAEFLAERSYDLHYVPRTNGRTVSMGLFNLWRVAVQYPGSPVPACIHRAPEDGPQKAARLLLIA